MSAVFWIPAATTALVVAFLVFRAAGRSSRTRDAALAEVRHILRGGVIEALPAHGPQARGRLGELEITVGLHRDPQRPVQSPMWRVLAVGPVRMERPIEARVAGWQGWIDPWLQLGETLVVPAGEGPEFTVHTEHSTSLEHPIVVALRRQGPSLGPGALHARADVMRAEVRYQPSIEGNRPLFAYLHAMVQISELPVRAGRETARPTLRVRHSGARTQETR